MKYLKKIISFSLLLILLFSVSAFADTKYPNPLPKKYISDYAGVIPEDIENKIAEIGNELYRKTGAEVAAVIMENTGDIPIEDYANGLFRTWGIGSKEKNNGVLILVAFKNPSSLKKSRIEVGYGLEGILPDGKTGRIQDEYMIPYFKNGDYGNGILYGYAAVCSEVAKEYDISLSSIENSSKNSYSKENINIDGISINPIVLIILLLFLFSFDGFFLRWSILRLIIALLFKGGRGGRGGFGGGGFGGFGGSGGGFGGFGGGSSGGGGSSRDW